MKEKRVKIPERFNYAEMYLTLRCNFKCPYCINNNDGRGIKTRRRKEINAEQWANALNKIQFGKIPLTIGGGEPTLHAGFFELLDRLRPDIKVDLLTNLQFDIGEFMKRTRPERFTMSSAPAYRAIRVSYHVGQSSPIDLIEKVEKLQERGYSVGIFGLDIPQFVNENMRLMEMAVDKRIFFFPKNFLGVWNGQLYGTYKYPSGLSGKREEVSCRTREILVDPSGEIYRCHRDLYKAENPVGNILNPELKIEDQFRPCANFGECNPCDVKLKTNFYLDGVSCQVEIIDKKTNNP